MDVCICHPERGTSGDVSNKLFCEHWEQFLLLTLSIWSSSVCLSLYMYKQYITMLPFLLGISKYKDCKPNRCNKSFRWFTDLSLSCKCLHVRACGHCQATPVLVKGQGVNIVLTLNHSQGKRTLPWQAYCGSDFLQEESRELESPMCDLFPLTLLWYLVDWAQQTFSLQPRGVWVRQCCSVPLTQISCFHRDIASFFLLW